MSPWVQQVIVDGAVIIAALILAFPYIVGILIVIEIAIKNFRDAWMGR